MRAVLDPNVLISALLSKRGAPAQLLRAWIHGHFELIVSPRLLEELKRALAYPKLRKRIHPEEAAEFIDWLSRSAITATDSTDPPAIRSTDPDDDYLLALASSQRAALVTGDRHLLDLDASVPVHSPRAHLKLLGEG